MAGRFTSAAAYDTGPKIIEGLYQPVHVDEDEEEVKRKEAEKRSKEWLSRKLTPSHQLLERKIEAEELSRRVRGLVEKARS